MSSAGPYCRAAPLRYAVPPYIPPTAGPAMSACLEPKLSAPRHPRVDELIQLLRLQPHPEGGHYREIHRAEAEDDEGRAAVTTIDFLLAGGETPEFSAWHRVDADEVWHLLEGDGLRLWMLSPEGDHLEAHTLGRVTGRHRPRVVVPAGWWQAAEPCGDFAYVGATVAPGFQFEGFEFGRDDPFLKQWLGRDHPDLLRLL